MKKSVKILLSTLCLLPLALSACKNYNYYTITATSSASTLGSVSGFSQEKVEEESVVKLVARENDSSKNPLLGWVKNNEYLVKVANHTEDARDNTLELTVGEGTEGNYTAVFAENEDSMMYAYAKSVQCFNDGIEFPDEEIYDYQISYAIMSSGSDNYLPFEDKVGEGINTNILYFGGLGQDYEFKFKVTFILPLVGLEEIMTPAEIAIFVAAFGLDAATLPSDSAELRFTCISSTTISKSTFDENKIIEFKPVESSCKISFIVEFAKFSTDLVNMLPIIEEPEK